MKQFLLLIVLAAISMSGSAQVPGYVKQEGGETNVRKGPGNSYEIAGKKKDGTSIYYEPSNGSWYKVYNSKKVFIGYMHSSKIVASNSHTNSGVPSIPSKSTNTRSTAQGTQYDWLAQKYATYNDISSYERDNCVCSVTPSTHAMVASSRTLSCVSTSTLSHGIMAGATRCLPAN